MQMMPTPNLYSVPNTLEYVKFFHDKMKQAASSSKMVHK